MRAETPHAHARAAEGAFSDARRGRSGSAKEEREGQEMMQQTKGRERRRRRGFALGKAKSKSDEPHANDQQGFDEAHPRRSLTSRAALRRHRGRQDRRPLGPELNDQMNRRVVSCIKHGQVRFPCTRLPANDRVQLPPPQASPRLAISLYRIIVSFTSRATTALRCDGQHVLCPFAYVGRRIVQPCSQVSEHRPRSISWHI